MIGNHCFSFPGAVRSRSVGRLQLTSARSISQLLIPFLQLAISHMATSHLSRPRGLSSKTEPFFTDIARAFIAPA